MTRIEHVIGVRILSNEESTKDIDFTFGVLPVAHTRGHLPVTLLLDGDAARGRVQHWSRGRGGSAGDLLVDGEARGLHRIHLRLYHSGEGEIIVNEVEMTKLLMSKNKEMSLS